MTYVKVVQQRSTLQKTSAHGLACGSSTAYHESSTHPERSGNANWGQCRKRTDNTNSRNWREFNK